jgi:hypothetical protein
MAEKITFFLFQIDHIGKNESAEKKSRHEKKISLLNNSATTQQQQHTTCTDTK